MINELSKIRYTQSMILAALEFWRHKYSVYLEKIKKFDNKVFGHCPSHPVSNNLNRIHDIIQKIKSYGSGFIYTHYNIFVRSPKSYGELNQRILLFKKLNMNETQKKDIKFTSIGISEPCFRITIGFIKFIAFPNIHPYVPRRRIKSVGITEKGNVYIINAKPTQS